MNFLFLIVVLAGVSLIGPLLACAEPDCALGQSDKHREQVDGLVRTLSRLRVELRLEASIARRCNVLKESIRDRVQHGEFEALGLDADAAKSGELLERVGSLIADRVKCSAPGLQLLVAFVGECVRPIEAVEQQKLGQQFASKDELIENLRTELEAVKQSNLEKTNDASAAQLRSKDDIIKELEARVADLESSLASLRGANNANVAELKNRDITINDLVEKGYMLYDEVKKSKAACNSANAEELKTKDAIIAVQNTKLNKCFREVMQWRNWHKENEN